MKRLFMLFAFAAIFATTATAQLPDGSIAPDWTMTDINGVEHTLSSYLEDGYTVVLDFSATWCGLCWSYHQSGALEELYINHGPAGMPNVSASTTDDVMVLMIEGDVNTTDDELHGIGAGTQGDWVTGTPYPIIDDHAITTTYAIGFWPTIYTICANGVISESGQLGTEAHYELAYACAVASLDYGVTNTSPTVQDGATTNTFTLEVTTANETEEILQVSYITDAPADWNAGVTADGTTDPVSVDFTSVLGTTNNVSLNVVPGPTPALANYTVQISSLTNPSNPVLEQNYFVASGITDIIVDHKGVATQWNDDFIAGLDLAGNTTYGLLDTEKFIEAITAGQLSEVGHIYYNMGWNFPSFTDDLVGALETFIDGGGNMYISGQDIAWDTFNNEGTSTTQAFFTNYISASYVGDGSASNNQLTWNTESTLFGEVENSSIIDVYDGNIYPDEVNPIEPAFPIFYYNNNENKIGGLRVQEDNHKIVFVGVDQGMISDEDVRHELIQISHDWFHGIVSGIEVEEAFANVFGNNYPNPAEDYTIIPLENLNEDVSVTLIDAQGKIIFKDVISQGASNYRLNLNGLNVGLYQYVITNAKGQVVSNPIEILK